MLATASEHFGSYPDRGYEMEYNGNMQFAPYNTDLRGPAAFEMGTLELHSSFQQHQPAHFAGTGASRDISQVLDSRYGQPLNHQLPLPKPAFPLGGANAPLLPPIRAVDRSHGGFQSQVRSKPAVKISPLKEEKVGGVTAHLDYEMEEMVDFVSEMAQGMYGLFLSKIYLADIDLTRSVLSSRSSIHPTLRKFVSQVLTSTRLPSSTILLALHYLTIRLTMLSARGSFEFGASDVYSLLTTALLLGSKFLDDNTFQNRSWSDVSNISVERLNVLESDWLRDIKWDMHFDPTDPKGFELWRRRWQRHQAHKMDSLAESMKLACLETNLHRGQSARQPISPISAYPPAFAASSNGNHAERTSSQWQMFRSDRWASPSAYSQYSPPSAPETGPATPDHAPGFPPGLGYPQLPLTYSGIKIPPALSLLPSNAPPHRSLNAFPPGLFPPYTAQCNQYPNVGNFCSCQYCLPSYERFAMPSRYGPAAVS